MKGTGIVTSIDRNKAKVMVTTGAECFGCPSKSHCTDGIPTKREIVVINESSAKVTDYVIFESDTGKVILSAALIWIIPLVSMIVGYVVAQLFTGGFWPVGAAFLFFAGSFILIKLIDRIVSGGTAFYPKITQIAEAPERENQTCDLDN
ncbi:SoxR reducing system RseC family protein [Candidatus Latescibacterota bacterium]